MFSVPLQVVTGSDVLFLSGSLKHIEATLESIQSSLEDKQIVVAVSKDAKLDELQVSSLWHKLHRIRLHTLALHTCRCIDKK